MAKHLLVEGPIGNEQKMSIAVIVEAPTREEAERKLLVLRHALANENGGHVGLVTVHFPNIRIDFRIPGNLHFEELS